MPAPLLPHHHRVLHRHKLPAQPVDHLAETKPAEPCMSQYQPGSLIRRGPSVQAPPGHVSRAEPGRPLRRHFLPLVYVPAKQLLLLSEMPGPNPTGSATGSGLDEVDVPAFPAHDFCQRKDTFYSRSIPFVDQSHLSTGQRTGGKPTEKGSKGSWTNCTTCDYVKAMTQAVLSGSPQVLESL